MTMENEMIDDEETEHETALKELMDKQRGMTKE